MKEVAPVKLEPAAAQLPVRTEEEVVIENTVFLRIEHAPGDKAEIGDVLFILAAPATGHVPPRGELQRHAAQVLLFSDTVTKPRVAGAEDAT